MYPFFFGESDKQLYGVYQEPTGGRATRAGILMCAPLGQEYMRSHFSLRRLAGQFAGQGLHSMRFDYFGTGDSSGTSDQIDMSTCLSSLKTAMGEFQDTAGISKVSILGLRFGALPAMLSAGLGLKVESIILWDPIVSGKSYVDTLRQLCRNLQHHPGFQIPGGRPEATYQNGREEIIGYTFSERFVKEIESYDLSRIEKYPCNRISLYVSHENEEYAALHRELLAREVSVDYKCIPDAGNWSAPSEIDQMLMPSLITKSIAEAAGPGGITRN